jgi:CheY-like chemotaxis protein
MAGHDVTEAAGGEDGLRAFRETPVDLVVTDLELGDLSGWEVARTVRRLRPDVPVVLITGNPGAAEAAPHLRALVDAILLKPFGARALLEVVKGLTTLVRADMPPEVVEPAATPGLQTTGLPFHGPAPRRPSHDREEGRQLSVLLVEDNPGDARLIHELLRDNPALRVVSVETLASALAHLAQPGMDLVLLDLGLPDSQGLDTVARVVQDHPALPVIVVTGREDDELARATLTSGAEDYLVKGALEPARLIRSIQDAYARKRGNPSSSS